MRYRPQRGGLAEAMALSVDLEDFNALVQHMRTTEGVPATADPATMSITPYGGDDDRIGWKDVHLVSWEGGIGYIEGNPRGGIKLGDPPALSLPRS